MSTQKISKFITESGYEQIPHEAVSIAKMCILDGLGVSLAAPVEPPGRIIIDYVKEMGGRPEAGVIGAGFKSSSPQAALANGMLAHALDYDNYSKNIQHPTAVILPTVMALAEQKRASGQEILEAFILGWEVGAKVSGEISYPLIDRGWHATGIVGPIAAVAAAARILDLDENQARKAMGIAASQAGGLRQNFGTDTKPLHAGNAARSGVMGALLAKKGFTASESILEGHLGMPEILLGKELDADRLSQGLGSPFDIVYPGAGIKPYPICALAHRSITAILEMIEEHHIQAEEVVHVECKVHPMISQILAYHRPLTAVEGKFSIEYAMAAALLHGEVTLAQVTDEKVSGAEAQDLMQRVRISTIEAEEAPHGYLDFPQIIMVRLRDGREYSHQVRFAKGDPQKPLTQEEVGVKFRDCARSVLSQDEIDRTIELVLNLDSLKDITELMNIVTT